MIDKELVNLTDLHVAERIRKGCHSGDSVIDHIVADSALVGLLKSISFHETVKEYSKVKKHYY